MGLTRNKVKQKFTQIVNDSIIDINLSDGAFRVLCYLLSKPDGWQINNVDVQKQLNIGDPHTMSRYWKQLIVSGWVSRERRRHKGKLIGGFEYHLNVDNTQYGKIPNMVKPLIRENTIYGKTHTHSNTDSSSNTNIDNNTKEKKKEKKGQTPLNPPLSILEKKLIKRIGSVQFDLLKESREVKVLERAKKVLLVEYLEYRLQIKKRFKTVRPINSICEKFKIHSIGDIRKVLDLTLENEWVKLVWSKLEEDKQKQNRHEPIETELPEFQLLN